MKKQYYRLTLATACSLLFVISSLPLHAQNFRFAKGFGNSAILGGALATKSIAVDGTGNVYIIGTFAATADFDPGSGVANLTSVGSNDIYFAKYDPSGNYIYAKAIGSSGNETAGGIALDGSGNVYISGYTGGVMDFDPSSDVFTLPIIGTEDVFIAKYDASGNYVYAKVLGGPSYKSVSGIEVDAAGNTYISGNFGETMDFNPGTGTAILVAATSRHQVYIAKYDAVGNYVFAKQMGGDNSDYGFGIAVDLSGGIYITGSFNGSGDFDPGAGTATLTSVGTSDIFIAKYDASGNYIYAKAIGGTTGEVANGIGVDASGYVYLTGSFQGTADFNPAAGTANLTSAGNNDIFFARYDASGNYVYARRLGSTSSDLGYSITADASGNAYVTGSFQGSFDFDAGGGITNIASAGSTDIFIVKYNASGDYVYAKTMGSSGSDDTYKIALDASGNVYTAGRFQGTVDFDPGVGVANLSSATSATNSFVARFSNAGSYSLAISQGGYAATVLNDNARAIATDAAGNIYITGSFSGTIDFDQGPGIANLTSVGGADVFIAKYSAAGNYVYAKAMGGALSDNGAGITVDASGNIYIIGSFNGTADFDPGDGVVNLITKGGSDAYFAKYDASGNFVYVKNVGGSSGDNGTAIAVDASNNVYVIGAYYSATTDFDPGPDVVNLPGFGNGDFFVAKYDASGNYIWANGISAVSEKVALGLALDASGNAYVTGYFSGTVDFDPGAGTVNLTSGGSNDIFIAKYDAAGNYVYTKAIGGTSNEVGGGIALDGSSNIYITGYFQGSPDFDPGEGVASFTSAGANDIFIAKYDVSGNYIYAKALGGTLADNATSIAIDASGNTFITGYFNGTADFDPNGGTANFTSAGSTDIFVAKYDASGNYVYAKIMGGILADNGNSIAIDGSGNAFVIGYITNTVDFNPEASSSASVITGSNGQDIFLASFGSSATLPVNWLTFTAVPSDDATVLLSWKTASETGNQYFEVQRSRDGIQFEPIGRQQACTSCNTAQSYNFIDVTTWSGVIYYRLKQVDNNSRFSHSKIVSVNRSIKSKTAMLVYPTVTKERCSLVIKNNPIAEQMLLQVVTASGGVVKGQKAWLNKGDNTIEINLSGLAPGLYYVQVIDSGKKTTSLKVIKR